MSKQTLQVPIYDPDSSPATLPTVERLEEIVLEIKRLSPFDDQGTLHVGGIRLPVTSIKVDTSSRPVGFLQVSIPFVGWESDWGQESAT